MRDARISSLVYTSVASDTRLRMASRSESVWCRDSESRDMESWIVLVNTRIWLLISEVGRSSGGFSASTRCTVCFGGEGGTIVIIGDLISIDEIGEERDLHDSDLESKSFGGLLSSLSSLDGCGRGIDSLQPILGNHSNLNMEKIKELFDVEI